MAIPAAIPYLQDLGFNAKTDGGHLLQGSTDGNCFYIFGWNIESVRLWYSVFLVECLDITLFYIVVCKRSTALPVGAPPIPGTDFPPPPPTPPQPPAEETEPTPPPPPAPPGPGTGTGAAGGTAPTAAAPVEGWVATFSRRATETTCSLGSASDVSHTDLQNLFNTKLGIFLPDPPEPD